MRRRRTNTRLRLYAILALGVVGAIAALFLIPGKRPEATQAGDAPQLDVRVFMVAGGIFAQPAPGQETGTYAAAVQTAQSNNSSLAYVLWTDQESFETQGWRDIVGVRRIPISRPPKIDFVREVLVLAWPVPGKAPAEVLQAPGLTIRAAAVQQHGIALTVGPTTSGIVATPVGGGTALPYALISVPRNQWPIPVPAPDVPPLLVGLAA